MINQQWTVASPLRTGIALAVTVGLFYALCTLVWVAAPGAFMNFMNSLFHGMDFSSMVQPQPFLFPRFLTALLVLSTWAFFVGAFFAWLRQRLASSGLTQAALCDRRATQEALRKSYS